MASAARRRAERGGLQHRQGHAGVAVGVAQQRRAGLGVERHAQRREPALGVGQRAIHDGPERLGGEPLQHHHHAARAQRAVHLEARVLGGGADQRERAVLDRGEQRVLLRAVEAVDLVEEAERAPAHLGQVLAGLVDDAPHVGHAGGDGRERHEPRAGGLRGQARQRGLAGARRAPQDQRDQPPLGEHPAQRGARAQRRVLPHDLVERGRTHPVGQRRRAAAALGRGGVEEVGHGAPG